MSARLVTIDSRRLFAMTEALKLALYVLKSQPFRHCGPTDSWQIARRIEAALAGTTELTP